MALRIGNVELESDTSLEAIVQRLRQAVKDAGGNQVVAENSGIPLSTLNDYLKGNEVKFSRMAKLAIACRVSLNWLWEGRDHVMIQSQSIGNSIGFTDSMLAEPAHFLALAHLLATCQEFHTKTHQIPSLAEAFVWIAPNYEQARRVVPDAQIRLRSEQGIES